MSFDGNNKRSVSIPVLPVKVLGGTFHVAALLVADHNCEQDVIAVLHGTAADRWFVMVSDHAGDAPDALAMIDDNLEFQIYAHGVLRQD
ncbi:MAG TPA: hypothetical protein VKB51_10700 [bacterium]|nr:hypothetical protein [bacterium]